MGARRIAVRSTNWIGDAVMSLAALRELRRLHAGDHLALVGRPWVAGIFEHQGIVDQVIALEEGGSRWKQLRACRRALAGFDTVVLFPNAFQTALAAFWARVPERIGYATEGRGLLLSRRATPRTRDLGRHQIYHYLDLLHQTGLAERDYLQDAEFRPDIRLIPPSSGLEAAARLLESAGRPEQPLVIINPGAYYGAAKRWFTDRYARLADRLIEDPGARVVLIGSAGEERIAREIQSQARHTLHVLTGRTDLDALLGLLSRADLFVTNDSGPMHLGAALEVPMLALFGSTDDTATGPFSARARVIHKHVECSPCLLRECPIDLRCFARIEVDEVYRQARALLDPA